MKVQRKIDSLVRRNIQFTTLIYDWQAKNIEIFHTPE